jgi:hypothetical protein
MVEHGYVEFRARALTDIKLSNISQVIAKSTGDWDFGEANHDLSLTISNTDRYFCTNCYYLIEVTAETPAALSLLLHSKSSPVPLKENRVIR